MQEMQVQDPNTHHLEICPAKAVHEKLINIKKTKLSLNILLRNKRRFNCHPIPSNYHKTLQKVQYQR